MTKTHFSLEVRYVYLSQHGPWQSIFPPLNIDFLAHGGVTTFCHNADVMHIISPHLLTSKSFYYNYDYLHVHTVLLCFLQSASIVCSS